MPEVHRAGSLAEISAACLLLDRPNFAVLASHDVTGAIHQTVMWVLRDGNDLLFSTVRGRGHWRNLGRDSRASVITYDTADSQEYVAVEGVIDIEPDPDRALSNRLARKYTGADHVEADPSAVRVVLRLHPQRVLHRLL